MTKEQIAIEALTATENRRRCGLAITMAGGKTYIGLQHMARLFEPGDEFLVAAPKTSVYATWKEEAEKYGMTYLLPHIRFTTYLSLPKQHLNYKAIYLDECHSLLYTHDFWLSQYGGYILGLTGTRPRFRKSEKGSMVQKFCPIVYSYIVSEAVEDGILNDYRIVIHHLGLDARRTLEMINKSTGAKWYQSEKNAYKFWHDKIATIENAVSKLEEEIDAINEQGRNHGLSTRFTSAREEKQGMIDRLKRGLPQLRIMRMRALMGFPSKVSYSIRMLPYCKNKTLVFANTQQQADDICSYSYHAKNPDSEGNLELFKKGDILQMSSVMQLIEGINIPGLKEGIILHAYSNERKSPQRIGRFLRLSIDDTALIHVLCYDGTIDEKWVGEALQDFDREKIYHYYPEKDMFVDTYGNSVSYLEMPWGLYRPHQICPKGETMAAAAFS